MKAGFENFPGEDPAVTWLALRGGELKGAQLEPIKDDALDTREGVGACAIRCVSACESFMLYCPAQREVRGSAG